MQLLVASGFTLPWQDDVLVPRARFLASLDLTDIEAVDVGKSGNYVAIRIGPWTFYLRVDAGGRFPKVMDSVPDAATAIAHCKLSADDVLFLAENLPKLPCDDEENLRVTLEMNGGVAVRAKSADTTTPTEIVLTNSCSTGSAIRVNANRSYLARAARLGLHEIYVSGKEAALLFRDDSRQFVFMSLTADSAIKPNKKTIRIESPAGQPTSIDLHPSTERRTPPMTEPIANGRGRAAKNGRVTTNGLSTTNSHISSDAAGDSDPSRSVTTQNIGGLIGQAESLRTFLRNALEKNNELLANLKRRRQQNRMVQQTIAQLQNLKTLGD